MATEQYPKLDAGHLISILLRRWWLVALLVAGAFAGVYLLSGLQTAVYSSVAEVAFTTPDPSLTGNAAKTASAAADAKAAGNEMYFIRSTAVRDATNAALGDEAALVKSVEVAPLANTDIMLITVASTSPEVAKNAANLYATNYVTLRSAQLQRRYADQAAELRKTADGLADQVSQIDKQIEADPRSSEADVLRLQRADYVTQQSDLRKQANDLEIQQNLRGDSVAVAKTAGTPAFPDSPTPLRDAGVAGMVALVFALGLVFLLEQLDNRIKSPQQVEAALGGVPVIGSIPVFNPTRSRFRHFGHTDRTLVPASSAASQAYHTLATSLRFSSLGKEKRTILVTSSTGGEGKTTVTANLAAVLAESGLKVVLVSADLRRPMLGGMFGVEDRGQGLTSAMLGDVELSSSCFVSVPLPSGRSIFVLPAGPLPHEPSVLLGSDMFGTILDQIKQAGADFILVDCAPVLPVSDPLAAARHVDGVIVLSLYGKTKTTNLRTTIERLRQVDAEIMGVVVNGIPATGGYGGYYGYGSNYSSYASTTAPPPPKGAPPAETSSAANGKAPAGVGPGAISGSAREHDPDFL